MGSQTASVAVLYASDYGYSDRLSQTLAKGITKAGVPTDMIDMLSADPAEVVHLVGRSAGALSSCSFCFAFFRYNPVSGPRGGGAHRRPQRGCVFLPFIRISLFPFTVLSADPNRRAYTSKFTVSVH